MCYNPFKQYHVTSKTCIKNKDKITACNYSLFELLDKLTNREYTGHECYRFNKWLLSNSMIIYKIIDKDLGIRVGDSIINKAVPGSNTYI